MTDRAPGRHRPGGDPAAGAAAVWALAFAAASAYWALGGSAGTGTLARDLAAQADTREPGFVALLWVAAVAKALLALPALALRLRLGARTRRRVVIAATVLGAGLVLYGAAGFADFALMAAGARPVPAGVGEPAVFWYLVLWEPVWMLGGALFLVAAHRAPPPLPDRMSCGPVTSEPSSPATRVRTVRGR